MSSAFLRSRPAFSLARIFVFVLPLVLFPFSVLCNSNNVEVSDERYLDFLTCDYDEEWTAFRHQIKQNVEKENTRFDVELYLQADRLIGKHFQAFMKFKSDKSNEFFFDCSRTTPKGDVCYYGLLTAFVVQFRFLRQKTALGRMLASSFGGEEASAPLASSSSVDPDAEQDAKTQNDVRNLLGFLLINKNNCLDFAESSPWPVGGLLSLVDEVRLDQGVEAGGPLQAGAPAAAEEESWLDVEITHPARTHALLRREFWDDPLFSIPAESGQNDPSLGGVNPAVGNPGSSGVGRGQGFSLSVLPKSGLLPSVLPGLAQGRGSIDGAFKFARLDGPPIDGQIWVYATGRSCCAFSCYVCFKGNSTHNLGNSVAFWFVGILVNAIFHRGVASEGAFLGYSRP